MKTIHVYDIEGDSSTIEVDGNGPDMFRKMLKVDDVSNMTEFTIAKLLKNNPQPNVVKIYDVVRKADECYIDMELLTDNYVTVSKYADDFRKGLHQLHSLGVVYIDIKSDNIGYSQIDGVYKIFDFDCSGIVDINNPKQWVMEPFQSHRYKQVKYKVESVDKLYELDELSWNLAYRKKF